MKIKQWVEEPQISIIMEYLECGSFIVYLSSKKPNLTNEKLLQFALDIAKVNKNRKQFYTQLGKASTFFCREWTIFGVRRLYIET